MAKEVIENKSEMNARVYDFPTSALRINDKRINYYSFITSLNNKYCNEAIKIIYPRIDLVEIN